MPTITTKEGDKLWNLAQQYLGSGSRWKELGSQIGITTEEQARKLPIGVQLTIPEGGGSLAGTLPKEEKTLPETTPDTLSVFRNLLKTVSERAGQQATATGVAGAGFEPSAVSGGTLAGIVDFIKSQKTTGIADIYKSTVDLLDAQQKQAQDHLKLLIDSKAMGGQSDQTLAKLSSTSGMDYDLLLGIRDQQKQEAKIPKSWATVDEADGQYRLGFDTMGNIISKTKIAGPKGKGFTWKDLTPTDKQDLMSWLAKQEEFEPSWIKRLDDEPDFAEFIIAKYYQQKEEEW